MFLTSFNVCFVFSYAFFMCICFKTAICFFLAFLGTRSGFFWWIQVGNPGSLHFSMCVTWQPCVWRDNRTKNCVNSSKQAPLKELSLEDSLPDQYNLKKSALFLFEVTVNYLFSKYRLKALIFKIPVFYRPLLN